MRVLGIDWGSTAVKAVEIDSVFRRFEIHEYHEQRIEPGADATAAVRELMSKISREPARIVVAMRSSRVTFRNLELPTRDRKAIQASVGFELDDDLPFPIEDSAYDYAVLSRTGQTSHVHVAATLKTRLQENIDFWAAAGVEPDVITTEAWAYRALMNRVVGAASASHPVDSAHPAPHERPTVLARLGHSRTVFYVHWRGFPAVVRELSWGGRDLTAAICRRYGIPLDQAERTKLDHGFVLPPSQRAPATAEQVAFSEIIYETLQPFIRELRQVELVCKNITHHNVGSIHLTGGTSLLPGLAPLLEEELGLPVHPLRALSAISGPSGVAYSEATDAAFSLAGALAYCIAGPERTAPLNLRKGEFSKNRSGGRKMDLAALRGPLAALGAVAASFLISMTVQNNVYRGRIKETNARLEKAVRQFFPQAAALTVKTYVGNTPSLRKAVSKELDKQHDLARLTGTSAHSPLEFLKTLSTTIPKDQVVDLTLFTVGAAPGESYSPTQLGTASLTFIAASPQTAEKIATLLSSKLTGIQRSKVEEVAPPDGGEKRWRIVFTGKPTEDAYGK